MATWNERLAAEMAAKQLSNADLARRSRVNVSLISKYKTGKVSNPHDPAVIPALAAALEVNEAWLRLGVGPKTGQPVNPSLTSENSQLRNGGTNTPGLEPAVREELDRVWTMLRGMQNQIDNLQRRLDEQEGLNRTHPRRGASTTET